MDPHLNVTISLVTIAHFTVTGENKAGIDLVLIQSFLICYVSNVNLILTMSRLCSEEN